MKRIICVLDACSVINLIHIDEDDFLLKRLSHLELVLCEKVFKEINTNVYDKLNKERKRKSIEVLKKEIDQKLTIFRRFQLSNDTISKELGENYFKELKEIIGYKKDNGEFFSVALALYLSRERPSKLFFHTDDGPARSEFNHFFKHQQIGYIEDTVDLLVLIYRLDDNFNLKTLDNLLSNLFSEYASKVASLEKKIRDCYSQLTAKSIKKDRNLKPNLAQLIEKLHNYDFKDIDYLLTFFLSNKSKYRIINEHLNYHKDVFELQTSSASSIIDKIKTVRKNIHDQKVMKLLDLVH